MYLKMSSFKTLRIKTYGGALGVSKATKNVLNYI